MVVGRTPRIPAVEVATVREVEVAPLTPLVADEERVEVRAVVVPTFDRREAEATSVAVLAVEVCP